MLSPQVVTRQYRAPELLFGAPLYEANAVDVWALACIAAELFNRAIFFPGASDIDQLARIFAVMGPANDETWPGCQVWMETFLFSFLVRVGTIIDPMVT